MHSKVGIDTQSLPYGFQNEIIDHKCKMGLPKTIGSNVPNFVKDVPRVPKCVSRWGSATNHFLMGSKMKSCTIHVWMGVPEAIGLDVPNLMNDVPKFVKDVPSVPKCVLRW